MAPSNAIGTNSRWTAMRGRGSRFGWTVMMSLDSDARDLFRECTAAARVGLGMSTDKPLLPASPCAPLRECDMQPPPPEWTAAKLIWINRGARIAVVTVKQDRPAGILTAMRWLVGPDGAVALDHGSLAGEPAAWAEWARGCKESPPAHRQRPRKG